VLSEMRRQGLLDEARAREAMARPLPAEAGPARLRAPYFVDLAREEIAHRLTLPSEGEVRIGTSLDATLQRAAERAVQDGLDRIERRRRRQPGGIEAALVPSSRPRDKSGRWSAGAVTWIARSIGRREPRAARFALQPVVYLAAFELGGRGHASRSRRRR